jgi:hypothetical protein
VYTLSKLLATDGWPHDSTEDMLRQTEAGYLKMEAEIRLLRDSMRESADAAQAAAVDAMAKARNILRDVSDPAAEKKQKGIQSNGVFEINMYKSNYDVSRAVVAQKLYGYMWQVELALQDPTYENYFDNDAIAALYGFSEGLGVGARAAGNAAIDTGWGVVTFGFGKPWEVFDTSGEGYATSYAFARVGFEMLAGLGLGAVASAPGKLGKIAFAADMAGNGTAVVRGGYGVARDGELNFSNGADLVGGALGIGGGVLGKAFKSADEFADGTKSIDELAVGTKTVDEIVESSTDLMATGQLGGRLFPQEMIPALVKYLESRNVYLYEAINGSFDGIRGFMTLPKNPTVLNVLHELSHFLDFQKYGPDYYRLFTSFEREMMVLERLMNNRNWLTFTNREQWWSVFYPFSKLKN